MLGILQKELLNLTKENKPKKAKREFSAGFRGYGDINKKMAASSGTVERTTPNSQVLGLLNELSIGNVRQQYQQNLLPQRLDNRIRIQQSINRLTNSKPKSFQNRQRSNIQQNQQIANQNQQLETNSQREQKKLEMTKKFKSAYHLEQNYGEKAKKSLVLKQKEHQQQKLRKIYSQIKNCHKSNDFSNALLEFIFCRMLQLSEKSCPFSAEILGNLFKNFLLNSQYPKCMPKRQKQALNIQQLQKITKRSLFLYCFLQIPQLRGIQKNQFTFQELIEKIRQKGIITPNQQTISIFEQRSQFTVPYDFHLYQIKKKVERIEQPFEVKQCKAKPIPKTLYERPKSAKNLQFQKTESKPFSFVDKVVKKVKPEQFYHWETKFKASPIPESTYKTSNPLYGQQVNQALIKERAKKLLQTAKYPESMAYLEKYSEYKEQRNAKLVQHNLIPHPTVKSKSIPNFNRLHAMNVLQFQQIREQNKKQLKVVPFNFQQSKPKMNKTLNIEHMQKPKIKLNKTMKEETQPVKINATKKFQAYVDFRKKNQQKKQNQEKRKQNQQKQRLKVHEPYRKILKERMKDELIQTKQMKSRSPVKHQTSVNMMKVNIQQIYEIKPLLMQSKGFKKDQETAYSSLYEPII